MWVKTVVVDPILVGEVTTHRGIGMFTHFFGIGMFTGGTIRIYAQMALMATLSDMDQRFLPRLRVAQRVFGLQKDFLSKLPCV